MRLQRARVRRERGDGVDDEVAGHQVEVDARGVAGQRHHGHASLAGDELQRVVRPVVLLGLAGAAVADDHRGPVDRHRHAGLARLGDDPLGLVLGVLVVVGEALAQLQVVLEEEARVAAGDVAGADVLQPHELVGAAREVDDVPGALDVHRPGELGGDGQVVHRGEVEDLQGPAPQGRGLVLVEPEPRPGDVPDDETGAPGQGRLGGLETLERPPRLVEPALLHQRHGLRVGGAAQRARQQGAAEEPGEAGEQHGRRQRGLRGGSGLHRGGGRGRVGQGRCCEEDTMSSTRALARRTVGRCECRHGCRVGRSGKVSGRGTRGNHHERHLRADNALGD